MVILNKLYETVLFFFHQVLNEETNSKLSFVVFIRFVLMKDCKIGSFVNLGIGTSTLELELQFELILQMPIFPVS